MLLKHVRWQRNNCSRLAENLIIQAIRKRLRKKLRLREFQEMGFHVDFKVDIPANSEVEDAFFDKLFDFVDERELSIGGNMSNFYVSRGERNSTTDADREALSHWLQQQPEVSAVRVWPLDDTWHGPFKWL
ncbi:50S ribosome-binding protein YggL [Hymenobacter sp. BT559]|uniref:50S ribosome-binding protein YggL n=1 Tax=Hymenobacter sp. BT559 TaxID=2795729 RepID=UPI002570BC23|nr:50S ribosome-binding protein YggL [Hymenobacter sp. BT559]